MPAAVEFIGQAAHDDLNVPANAARLINCYREPVTAGGKTAHVLKSVLGTVQFCDISDVLGRGLIEVNDTLYAVAGENLYSINSAGTATSIGAVADDADTVLDGYGTNVLIAANGNYYVYDGATVSAVTGGAFTSVGSVAYVGGYAMLSEENGSRIEWTELNDPATRNALYVATAEGRDDKMLRVLTIAGDPYLFGTRSIEIWRQTGNSGASAFERISGGVIDRGLKSKLLLAPLPGGAFFIGDDDVPYLMTAEGLLPKFNAAVQTAIEEDTATNCFYYEDRGHKFCVIRFSDRPSWVFDISTNEWHERALGNQFSPWDAVASAKAYGSWRVMNVSSVVATLQRTNQDLGATMIRRAISTTFELGGEPFSPTLEIRCRRGHQNLGRDANIIASFSDDGGETWSPPDPRSIGDLGDYDQRAIWYEGVHEQFTARIDISDEAEIPIYSRALLEVA